MILEYGTLEDCVPTPACVVDPLDPLSVCPDPAVTYILCDFPTQITWTEADPTKTILGADGPGGGVKGDDFSPYMLTGMQWAQFNPALDPLCDCLNAEMVILEEPGGVTLVDGYQVEVLSQDRSKKNVFSDTVSELSGHPFFCGRYVQTSAPEYTFMEASQLGESISFAATIRDEEGFYPGVVTTAAFFRPDLATNLPISTQPYDVEVIMCRPTFSNKSDKSKDFNYYTDRYYEFSFSLFTYSPACQDYTQTNIFEAYDPATGIATSTLPSWIKYNPANETVSVYQSDAEINQFLGQSFQFRHWAYLDDDVNGEFDTSVDVFQDTTSNYHYLTINFIAVCREEVTKLDNICNDADCPTRVSDCAQTWESGWSMALDQLTIKVDTHTYNGIYHIKGINFHWTSSTYAAHEFECITGEYVSADEELDCGAEKVDQVRFRYQKDQSAYEMNAMSAMEVTLSNGDVHLIFGEMNGNLKTVSFGRSTFDGNNFIGFTNSKMHTGKQALVSLDSISMWTIKGKPCDCSTSVMAPADRDGLARTNPYDGTYEEIDPTLGVERYIQVYGPTPHQEWTELWFSDTVSLFHDIRLFCGGYGMTFSPADIFVKDYLELGDTIHITNEDLVDQTEVGYHSNIQVTAVLDAQYQTTGQSPVTLSTSFAVEVLDCVPTFDNAPQIADLTYTIFQDDYLEFNIPVHTFSPADCSWWTYTLAFREDDGTPNGKSLSSFIRYNTNNSTISVFQVDPVLYSGETFQVMYFAVLDDDVQTDPLGPTPGVVFSRSTLSDTLSFTLTFADDCHLTEFMAYTFEEYSYTIRGDAQEILFEHFQDTKSNEWGRWERASCGPISYELFRVVNNDEYTSSYINGQTTNQLIYWPFYDTDPLSLEIYNEDNVWAGEHVFAVQATLDLYPDVEPYYSHFLITIEAYEPPPSIGTNQAPSINLVTQSLYPGEELYYFVNPFDTEGDDFEVSNIACGSAVFFTTDFIYNNGTIRFTIDPDEGQEPGEYSCTIILQELEKTTAQMEEEGLEFFDPQQSVWSFTIELLTDEILVEETSVDDEVATVITAVSPSEIAEIAPPTVEESSTAISRWAPDLSDEGALKMAQITFSIDSITRYGLVNVTYSESLPIPANWTQEIDEEVLTVLFEKRTNERDQQYFKYNVTELNSTFCLIQLNFSEPLLVSIGQQADMISLHFNKQYFLQGLLEQYTLSKRSLQSAAAVVDYNIYDPLQYYLLSVDLPQMVGSQAILNQISRTATSVETTSKMAVTAYFTGTVVAAQFFGIYWSIFFGLQMILALPLMQTVAPYNLLTTQGGVYEFVNAHFFSKRMVFDSLIAPLSGTLFVETENSQRELAGYPSDQILVNFGPTLLFVVILAAVISMFALLHHLIRRRKDDHNLCCKRTMNWLRPQLIWALVWRMASLHYLSICLAVMISLKAADPLNQGYVECIISGLLLITLIAYPIIVHFMTQRASLNKSQEGSHLQLLANLGTDVKAGAMKYNLLFLVRRLAFSAAIILVPEPLFQVVASNLLTLAFLYYLIKVMPMEHPVLNAVWIAHEVIVWFCTTYNLGFTEFVPEPEDRLKLGEIYLYIVGGATLLTFLVLTFYALVQFIRDHRRRKLMQKIEGMKKLQKEKQILTKSSQNRDILAQLENKDATVDAQQEPSTPNKLLGPSPADHFATKDSLMRGSHGGASTFSLRTIGVLNPMPAVKINEESALREFERETPVAGSDMVHEHILNLYIPPEESSVSQMDLLVPGLGTTKNTTGGFAEKFYAYQEDNPYGLQQYSEKFDAYNSTANRGLSRNQAGIIDLTEAAKDVGIESVARSESSASVVLIDEKVNFQRIGGNHHLHTEEDDIARELPDLPGNLSPVLISHGNQDYQSLPVMLDPMASPYISNKMTPRADNFIDIENQAIYKSAELIPEEALHVKSTLEPIVEDQLFVNQSEPDEIYIRAESSIDISDSSDTERSSGGR